MEDAAGYLLKDGRVVTLRVAGDQDLPAIAGLFHGLSDESMRSRFNGACSPATLKRLARIDRPPGTVCVLAALAGEPDRAAAEARIVPAGHPGVAELALTVADDYQGSGLGRLLLGHLVERASAAGYAMLQAVVRLTNAPMLHLLEPYGWVLSGATDLGVASLEISAIGGTPAWPADEPGRRVLVEQRSWFDGPQIAAMRAAGDVVRVCLGPRRSTGRGCPLVATGACRLAAGADVIVPLLSADDDDCAAVLDAHVRRWPGRLTASPPA